MSVISLPALAAPPPPCGEGLGVGVTNSGGLALDYPPPQPSPAFARRRASADTSGEGVTPSSRHSVAMPFNSIGIIGAGAWGTALATVAARAGRAVTLYARDASHAAHITKARENPSLPGVRLPSDITVTNDIAQA